ncbi:MAG TPA: serine hydrolase domain-containing protein [Gemmatimonadales bacterium]|nr:serine hydrolase domain-containing protein [Gemmatimonadales bacterium]
MTRWPLIAVPVLVLGCAGRSATVAPPPEAPTRRGFEPVLAYLRSQVDSAFPGAAIAVGRHDTILLLSAVGHYAVDDGRPVTPQTIYDLASLTKVIGLTTAALMLVDSGRLDLEAPVQQYVPAFRGPGKERVTIRHLLTHSSGLPAWRRLFAESSSRDEAFALVDTTALLRQPGDTFIYSDVGAIALTQVVETITGRRLDVFLDARVFGPLGMTSTRYLPPESWRTRIAPTENDTAFRHRMLHGEVHDENAGRLDGVSGHAGLFSTAPDLARFAQWLLDSRIPPGRPAGGSGAFLPHDLVVEFTRRQNIPAGSSRALGWDTPSENSSAGTKFGPRAFGHTGFTGTSIWIDPDRDLFIILLSNRVNPTRANTRILQVRRRVADLVVETVNLGVPAP